MKLVPGGCEPTPTPNPHKKAGPREQAVRCPPCLPHPGTAPGLRCWARRPTSNGDTSSKTRKQPWGRLPVRHGGAPGNEHPVELVIARGSRARSRVGTGSEAQPQPHGPALHRRAGPRGGWAAGAGGCPGWEARETNRQYVRRKSKSKSSFPLISVLMVPPPRAGRKGVERSGVSKGSGPSWPHQT